MALGFIEGATSYEGLPDELLRMFMDAQAAEAKENGTVEYLEKVFKNELSMKMTDNSAKSRMKNLFVAYHGLLHRQGLSWLVECNPKLVTCHIVSAAQQRRLQTRLQLQLAQAILKMTSRDL